MRLRTALLVLWILAGCTAAPEPPSTFTPTVTPTLVSTSTMTPRPIMTATEPPPQTPEAAVATVEATPAGSVTPTAIPVTLSPAMDIGFAAPIRITLPEGWVSGSGGLTMQEGAGLAFGLIPFSVYTGSVTGGTGYITVLWGFPNVTPGAILPNQEIQIDVWSDGLRLLYLAILESGCLIGRDEPRIFNVGGREARGSYFAAEECPELPNTRGWFAALQEDNINFAFYMYAEPMEALDGAAREELQSILDSVEFDMSLLPTPQATEESGD